VGYRKLRSRESRPKRGDIGSKLRRFSGCGTW
jgi:hypothetical protein